MKKYLFLLGTCGVIAVSLFIYIYCKGSGNSAIHQKIASGDSVESHPAMMKRLEEKPVEYWIDLFGQRKNARLLDALKRMESPDDFSKKVFSETDRQQLFRLKDQIVDAIEKKQVGQ